MNARLFFLVGCSVAVLVALCMPTGAMAQDQAVPTLAPPASAVAVTETVAATPAAPTLYRVRLAVDGNIPGSVKMTDKVGALVPIRATVSAFQNGLLISTTQSNEQGRFQLPGLRPGVYSVVAAAGCGTSAYSVEVLPYQAEKVEAAPSEKVEAAPVALTTQAAEQPSPPESSSLDLVLPPCGEEELAEQPVPMESYPMMMGGGGGGGGGAGMLLGLAGLAGLAGLGGLGGGGAASPAAP